jgi:hypothetical protein
LSGVYLAQSSPRGKCHFLRQEKRRFDSGFIGYCACFANMAADQRESDYTRDGAVNTAQIGLT